MDITQLQKHRETMVANRTKAERDFLSYDGAIQLIDLLIQEESAQKAPEAASVDTGEAAKE